MRPFACIVAALIATPALADEAPQATAAAAATPQVAMPQVAMPQVAMPSVAAPSVADQIASFLQTSPAARLDDDGVSGVTPRDDGRIHGEVAVGVGTGGYRSLYMRSDMPVGETGRISIAIEDARYGGGYGPGYRLARGAVVGVRPDFQRCDPEGFAHRHPPGVLRGADAGCAAAPARLGYRPRR